MRRGRRRRRPGRAADGLLNPMVKLPLGRGAAWWAALAGCLFVGLPVAGEAQQAPPRRAEAPAWELSDLAVQPQWRTADARSAGSGGMRQAIIAAADETEGREDWRIFFARTNAEAVRDVVRRRFGVPNDGVQLLQGPAVHADGIEAAINRSAARFSGESNLLIVYLTGHAYVDGTGSPVFFTYFTRDAGDGTFAGVVHRDQLHEWLARAKTAARQRGAEFRSLLIVDACRVRVLAPPPSARITPSADWEWYGTREGRFAEAPLGDSPSPFTAAIVEASDQLARAGEATLDQLVTRVGRLSADRTGGRQEPEMIQAAGLVDSPVLIQSPRVAFGVQVVDAVTGLPLPNARVTVDAQQVSNVAMLRTAPGRHQLRVSATGYLRRSEEIDVGPDRTGQVLEIPVHPSLVLVRGQVAPARAVSLAWSGGDTTSGYYRLTATSEADGRFALRLPETARGGELRISEAGRILRVLAVPSTPTQFTRPPGSAYEGVPVIDLGVVALPSATSEMGTLYRASAASAGSRVPLPPIVSDSVLRQPPVLADAIASDRLRAVARYAESGRWRLARANLQEMLQSGTAMDAPTVRRLEGLLAWITVREGLADTGSTRLSELANQAGRGHPVVELAARAGIVQREGEELRRRVGAVPLSVENVRAAALRLSAASRWTPQAAADWAPVARFGTEQLVQANALALRGLLESQRWSDALLLADALAGSSIPQLDSLRAEVTPIAFRGALEASIAESMRSGNWDRARTLAQRVRSDFAANPALAVLASTVEQEAIPASTRRFYQQAQQQFAAGDLEAAWETYGLAQDSANQHYGDFITAQREYLRQQLFIQFLSRGEATEVAGNDSAAVAAYLRASEFDDRVDARVGEMLARGVPAPRGTVDTWRRRAEERARLPRVLRVTTQPSGVEVSVQGSRVGLTPVECMLPPTDAATVSARRGGWTQTMSAPLPPGRIARIHFSVPADTVAWPAPRSRQELAQEVLRIRPFTPTLAQPLQPPAPVRSSTAKVALALVGGVGGMLLGIQIGPGLFQCTGDQDPAYDNCSETAGEAEATGALLTGALGALIGWVGGRSIDNSRFAQAQGRMTDYPPLLEAWQRNVSLERERWIDGRLGPVQQAENARVARGVGSARATNDTIRQANSRLGPPRLEILPMERGGGLPRACLGSPSTDRPTSERSRRLPDTGPRSEFWSGSISGLLGYGAMSIRLAWSGNSFAGSLFTLEGESIISDGALKGSDVSWSAELIVDGVRRLASFRGRLVGNRIGGQVFIPPKGEYSFAVALSAGP